MTFEETIRDLSFYKKGEPISRPDDVLSMKDLPKDVVEFLSLASLRLVITRRSLAHIVQKGRIGILLAKNIERCTQSHSSILESDHRPDSPYKRYILFQKTLLMKKTWQLLSRQEKITLQSLQRWSQMKNIFSRNTKSFGESRGAGGRHPSIGISAFGERWQPSRFSALLPHAFHRSFSTEIVSH